MRDLVVAEQFLRRWNTIAARHRHRLNGLVPIGALQTSALAHPDAWVRRSCLSFLDHFANDESAAVFAAALRDPVRAVRAMALHGLSCERCRLGPLPVNEVAGAVMDVLRADPSPDIRQRAVPILLTLSDRCDRALPALQLAADQDADDLVRAAAAAALVGDLRTAQRSRKSMARRQRTSDRSTHRTTVPTQR